MKKILILTAGFGEGHNTAAKNLKAAFERIEGEPVDAETLDLLENCYGVVNRMARKTYAMAIDSAPALWQRFYDFLDHSSLASSNFQNLTRLHSTMESLLLKSEPDAVISTYPLYNYVIDRIFSGKRPRRFQQITVITDSISVNSLWYRCHSDHFILPNKESATVLRDWGIPENRIHALGFPVSLDFHPQNPEPSIPCPTTVKPRILWVVNAHRKKAPKLLKKLIESERWDLTLVTGRNDSTYEALEEVIQKSGAKVTLLKWTDRMPELMMKNHLVISKAGGATVQEAIAAKCPILLTKVVPGQEEGNYELLRKNQAGSRAEKSREVIAHLGQLFDDDAELWKQRKENISKMSKPGAAMEIARFVVDQINQEGSNEMRIAMETSEPALAPSENYSTTPLHRPSTNEKRLLLCDFHTHTQFSDGKLTLPDLIDFYGERAFDCLCVTDHLCDPSKLIGQVCKWSNLVLSPSMLKNYFAAIEAEKQRAWDKYELLLMTGIEFNKDGYTKKSSAHLLGVDLLEPIDPSLPIPKLIEAIQAQGALAIASHPHEGRGTWDKETLYFWENIEKYAPLLDAWEIANRDDLYNPIGLKRLPFIANSDFHKPKHIYSWKSLLYCEKKAESIKECIRENRDLSITMYRDHHFGNENNPDHKYELDFKP